MDNELEIVNNEGMMEAAVNNKPSALSTYLPIVAGAFVVIGGAVLLTKFVIKPAYEKHKAKKATETEPKSEE